MVKRSSILRRLRTSTSGNVMYMTAGLLLPILATIGAGVDLGQAYMAKTRLQQACDAGVLAGRRSMGDGAFGSTAAAAATRMFNFNYPTDIYGSRGITFTSSRQGANEVIGHATATIDTILMHMFGKDEFALVVDCTAKLETANTDIMFVLDTTGSMATINAGDTVDRLQALRNEVMSFFDTVADAQSTGTQIRYGVMPYSSNVNVGRLLYAADPNWMSQAVQIPSRTANFNTVQDPDTTATGSPSNGTTTYGGWSDTTTYQTGYTQTNCNARTAPANSGTTTSGGSNSTQTGQTFNGNGDRLTTFNTTQNYQFTNYRYQFNTSNSRCYVQSRTGTYTQTTPSTVTRPAPRQVFASYNYLTVNYNVAGLLGGGSLSVPTGSNGTNVNAAWNGCIMERDTVAFAATASQPATAYDLDVDLVPNSEATRWHVAMPNVAHPRASSAGTSQSVTPTTLTTTSDYQSYTSGTNATGGWAACPSQAMRLTSIPKASRSILQNYVNGLIAVGGTYHDVGMTWGTRFISPTGLFASTNTASTNNQPISRHIIFMTDGDMAPNPGIYGFQGQEYLMGRVGSTNTTTLTDRHNRRFQIACDAAKSRNITVWVVSFGTALNQSMRDCASADNAFQAVNQAELHARFQQIAQQITRLRLSQ
jgi:Flp pilus assembly protein TadG